MDFARPFCRTILFSAFLFSCVPALGQDQDENLTTRPAGGTGFVIGADGQALTNAQVVDGCDDVQVHVGGKTIKAVLVASDVTNNLALLKFDGAMPGGPSIRTTAPLKDEQIVKLGFTMGRARPATGVITALTGSSKNDTRLLQISAPIVSLHDTGGPLLDLSGHVIGVVAWPPGVWPPGATDAKRGGSAGRAGGLLITSGLAIKQTIVRAFLDAYGIAYKTSGPSAAREVTAITEEAKGYTFPIECIKHPHTAGDTQPPTMKQEQEIAAVNPLAQEKPGERAVNGIPLPPPNQEMIAVHATAQETPAGQRAVLYEEDTNNPAGYSFNGTVVWRIERAAPASGQPPGVILRADVEIPHKLSMRWSLERNNDRLLPASHVVNVIFSFPPHANHDAVDKVPGMMMKDGETTRGIPLMGVTVKVADNFFLVGLSSVNADRKRNMELLRLRRWVDLPFVYGDGKRSLIALDKGPDGAAIFAEAFAAWDGAGGDAADPLTKDEAK